jgi:fused signal recognition particle receptor
MGLFDFFSKKKKEQLNEGLEMTKKSVFSKITKAIAGKSKVDDEVLDNLEEILVTSDVGVTTTLKIIERIEARVARDKYLGADELNSILKEEIAALLSENDSDSISGFDFPKMEVPYVIMVVGVNGVGKTTTIGKLAYQFKMAGKSVLLGAADTFRAAAVDQLTIWSERVDVPLISQGMGADPASVAYDTLKSAVCEIRNSKLPDPAKIGNAGSFFKNPIVNLEQLMLIKSKYPDIPVYPADNDTFKLAAGWMIDKLKWKGFRYGDAGVYHSQALVLVNHGQASGSDILKLAKMIMKSVKENFGVDLEPEVNIH